MKFTKHPSNIPDENVLDLRARPAASADEHPRRAKQHVDFLSFVESSEHSLARRFRNWFTRAPKVPVEPPVEPDLPPPTPMPAPRSTGTSRVAWGPSLRFGAAVVVVVGLVVAARTLGHVQDVKGSVLGSSAEALQRLAAATSAAQDLKFGTSKAELAAAHDAFTAAEQQLDSVAGALKDLPGAGKIARADALLQAGQAVTSAATYLADGATALTQQPGTGTTAFLNVIKQFHTSLKPASVELQRAAILLQQVHPSDLPENVQQAFADIQAQLPSMQLQFQRLNQVGDFLESFLAADGAPKRYLFIFQNTNELRPTGGFLGSLAIVDVQNGAVQKVEVPSGGVYDLSGQTVLRYVAPQPFQLIQPDWNLQDANWFPDFPTSAKKVLQFYNSTGFRAVDGVVAMTPAVLQSFLQLTGPVTVPEVGETFTADNLQIKLQEIIKQSEAQDYTKPKLVLGYLTPKILDRVIALPQDQLWPVLSTLQDHLITRDIQLYFTDATAQTRVQQLGWAGDLRTNDRDYLHVNRTNLGGGKTDGVMEEVDSHVVTIAEDGSVVDTLTIIRKHTGRVGNKFTGGKNTIYLRAYVPEGSTLLQASGFTTIDPKLFKKSSPGVQPDPDLQALDVGAFVDESSGTRVSTETGHTVFGNWLTLEPGDSVVASFTYALPFKLHVGGFFDRSDVYSLLVQEQPGTHPGVSSTVHFPSSWQVQWSGSTADVFVKEGENRYRMSANLDRDQYLGLAFKQ